MLPFFGSVFLSLRVTEISWKCRFFVQNWSCLGLWGSLGFSLLWMHPFRNRLVLWTGFTGPSSIKQLLFWKVTLFLSFHYKADAYKKSHFEVTQYSAFLQLYYVTLFYWFKHRVYFTQKTLSERWLHNTPSLAETAQKFRSTSNSQLVGKIVRSLMIACTKNLFIFKYFT